MKRILSAISTPTAKSSAIFYFSNFFLSVLRYIFHLILLRLLSPGEYGEFLSYLSLIYLLGIPAGTIAGVVTKFVSEFQGRGDLTSTNRFFYYILRVISPITYGLGFLLILFAGPLADLFKAQSVAFIVLGVSMFISLYQTVIGSYLIAFQKFIFQSIVGFFGTLLTIGISILFIRLGFGATGAVIGQLLAGIITTLLIYWDIRKSIVPKIEAKSSVKFSLAGFTGYSFIYSLGTMALISVDILLARIFFDPHLSGIYSSLSILGRMILFGLTPLISLVLPMASHRHAASGSARSILIKLGSVVLVFGIIGAGIFTLFPALIIRVLSGSAYLEATPYLSIFAFSMVFFALSQFILSYLMAIGKPQANKVMLLAVILQPIALYLSRNSFSSFIWSNFTIQLILVISLVSHLGGTHSTTPPKRI